MSRTKLNKKFIIKPDYIYNSLIVTMFINKVMKNGNKNLAKKSLYFKNKLKDRLNYCKSWKHDIDMYLANKEITKQADEEFYKTRPILKIFLNIYFLPYNFLRLIRYLRIRHDYKKNEIEMVVLTKKLKDNKNWRTYGDK